MKNKIAGKLWIVLVFAVFIGMALGSGSKDKDNGKKEIVDDAATEEADEEQVEEPEEPEESKEPETGMEEVTIEEQVLVEQDGVKITATGMTEDTIWGEGVMLLIENDTDKNVRVGCTALIVNNYMITDLFSTSVAAGKKVNEAMYFTSNQLEAAGITNVGQIEIYFSIYDADTFKKLFDPERVVIETSAFDHMDTEAEAGVTGKELYNQDGIRIVGQYVDENSIWGAAVLLYIENTSGKNVQIGCDNMSINGFMVSPMFASTVYDGKKSFDDITIFSSNLEENGIETVEDIELNFNIYEAESFKKLGESGTVNFSVN